jgi:hypothetical protein
MLAVKIYELREDAKQYVEGEFISERGVIRWEPEDSLLLKCLFEDYPMTGSADEWIRGLQSALHGVYVRAGAAEER